MLNLFFFGHDLPLIELINFLTLEHKTITGHNKKVHNFSTRKNNLIFLHSACCSNDFSSLGSNISRTKISILSHICHVLPEKMSFSCRSLKPSFSMSYGSLAKMLTAFRYY